jgi:hypothetical protein
MKNLLASILMVFGVLTGSVSMASESVQCPNAVQVDVAGLSSTSVYDTAAVYKLFEAGDKQISISFIEVVLQSVNKLGKTFNDTLKLVKKNNSYSNHSCEYKGQNSKLTLVAGYTSKAKAVLSVGYVNYKNPIEGGNPISAKGYQAYLTTDLKALDAQNVAAYKTKVSPLRMDLDVQIPLDDYGTEGYTATPQIGQAKSVTYTVVE